MSSNFSHVKSEDISNLEKYLLTLFSLTVSEI